MMDARAAEDWVENVVSNGWRATTLGQLPTLVDDRLDGEESLNLERSLCFGNQEDRIELAAAVERNDSLPSEGDARLSVEVRSSGFGGRADLWVSRESLKAFASQLAGLDNTRRGQASLTSMSPDQFEMSVRAVTSIGHVAVEGKLSRRCRSENATFIHAVSFGFEIDPGQLSEGLRVSWLSEYV